MEVTCLPIAHCPPSLFTEIVEIKAMNELSEVSAMMYCCSSGCRALYTMVV